MSVSMQDRARRLVFAYVEASRDKSDPPLGVYDIYVVWFVKVLQNWKALVSTSLPDGRYYEVTHNGDKGETYLDVYVKAMNMAIPDEPPAERS